MQQSTWKKFVFYVLAGFAAPLVCAAASGPVSTAESTDLFAEIGVCAVALEEGDEAACPLVSCLTQQGYNECISCPGCTCDPRTDWCTAATPPPPPKTGCPNVSCLTEDGYNECISCPGCDCHPRTDQCYEPSPDVSIEETAMP